MKWSIQKDNVGKALDIIEMQICMEGMVYLMIPCYKTYDEFEAVNTMKELMIFALILGRSQRHSIFGSLKLF